MPAGLVLFAGFGAWSAIDWTQESSTRVLSRQSVLRSGVVSAAVVWAFLSINGTAPLDQPLGDTSLTLLIVPVTIVTVGLLCFMAWRYWKLHRQRPSAVSLALVTAAALLAETMLIVNISRTWQVSWWLWHIVILAAYGYIAYAAFVTLRLDGKAAGLFTGVGTDATVDEVRAEFRGAVEQLVDSLEDDERDAELAANDLSHQLGLTLGQSQILAGAASAIESERRHGKLHAAMAQLTQHGVRDMTAEDLARRSETLLGPVLGMELRCGVATDDQLAYGTTNGDWPEVQLHELTAGAPQRLPMEKTDVLLFAVARGGDVLGDIEIKVPTGTPLADEGLIGLFAEQLALSYENVRLYRELRQLFNRYVPQEVADRLVADPRRAQLGGTVVETTVLFADLRGFTAFSEGMGNPTEIVELLNRYFSLVVPIITEEGGTVDKFVGDAIMALFNTPVLQPDHALRAVRAAHQMQTAINDLIADNPTWPRFRVGVNTGPALVGNIGSDEIRNFTAIGDAVNVAARLETAAQPGQTLIGGTTRALVHHAVRTSPAGSLQLKGHSAPVEAFLLEEVL
ncbi:MAG: adenylate/guanylate cyclase domain-containing protein [Acidimicrobiia bacterium]|nr:adenylate/guanylate cyclase domain-containing protein [Acidimicrobiia bacterium]